MFQFFQDISFRGCSLECLRTSEPSIFPSMLEHFNWLTTYIPHSVTVNLCGAVLHSPRCPGLMDKDIRSDISRIQRCFDLLAATASLFVLVWKQQQSFVLEKIDNKFNNLLFGTCARAFLVTAWPIVARYNLAAGMLRDTLARCTFKGTKTHKIYDPDALASTWLGTSFHSFIFFLARFHVVYMPLDSTSASPLGLLPMAARASTFPGS